MKKFNFFEKLWEHGRTLRRVGLVLVMCLITITQVWANGYYLANGYWGQVDIYFNDHTTNCNVGETGDDQDWGADPVTLLSLTGFRVNVYQGSENQISWSKMYYRFYKYGSTPPSYSYTNNAGWKSNNGGTNGWWENSQHQTWELTNQDIYLVTANTESGYYYFDFYFDTDDVGYLSNNSTQYRIYFTVANRVLATNYTADGGSSWSNSERTLSDGSYTIYNVAASTDIDFKMALSGSWYNAFGWDNVGGNTGVGNLTLKSAGSDNNIRVTTPSGYRSDVTFTYSGSTVSVSATPHVYSITYKDKDNVDFSGAHMPDYPTTHTSGTATTLKKASKAGYVFDGWYTNSSCTGSAVTSLDATAYTSDITLYAKWTAVSLTAMANNVLYKVENMVPDGVTLTAGGCYRAGVSANNMFDLLGSGTSDGSSGPMQNMDNTDVTISDTKFSNMLYFKGAAASASAGKSTAPTSRAIHFKVPSTGKLDIWCKDPKNICLMKSGSKAAALHASNTGNQLETKDVTAGEYYLFATAGSTTLFGLRFRQQYNVTYSSLSHASKSEGATTICHGDAFEATFTADAHYTLPSDVTVTIGDAAQTKGTGYTWTVTEGVGTLSIDAAKVTGAINVSFNAAPESYTVTLTTNGGTINSGNVTSYTYGTGALLPTNVTKAGFVFDGWFDNSGLTGSAVTAISSSVTGAKAYWAKWSCKTPVFSTNLSTDEVEYTVGASATSLTVAASANSGTIAYQWYSNNENNYDTPTALANCTTATYKPSTEDEGTTYYFCKATNAVSPCTEYVNSNITPVTVAAAPTLTALVDGTGYTPANMLPSGTSISTEGQYVEGLSANTKFFVVGSASATSGETGVPEIKTKSGDRITVSEVNYDNQLYFKGAANMSSNTPTSRAIKFILADEGKLTVYGNGSKIKLIKEGAASATSVSFTSNAWQSDNLSAGTYYMYATDGSQRIVYIRFDEAPACTDPGLVFASATKTTTLCDAAPTNALTNTYGVAVTYTSTDETVATVASDGALTIKKAGTTTITASAEEQTVSAVTYCEDEASYTLTVNASVAAGLSYASTSVSKDANASNFTNALTNSHGLTVTYESSDPSVATVNASTGEVDVKAAGTTTITASSVQQKKSSTCYLAGEATYTLTVNTVYTVTYNAMGGTVSPTSETVSTATLPTPSHASLSFDGWYKTDGTKVTAPFSPTADITLYARWTGECESSGGGSIPAVATFNFNGGTFAGLDTVTSNPAKITAQLVNATTNNIPVLDSYYVNVAYNGNSSGVLQITTSDSYTQIDSIKFNSAASNNNNPSITFYRVKKNGSDSTTIGSAIKLYNGSSTNTWRATPYKIDIHNTPYTGKVRMKLTTGSSSVNAGLDNVQIFYNTEGSTPKACNKVLYHGNGAESGYIYDPNVYDDGDDPEVLGNTTGTNGVAFVKDGKTFQGWATSAGGDVEYSAGDEIEDIDDDVHLYAVWAEAATTYTVTYADGGATGDVPVDASSPYEEDAPVTILGKGSLAKTGYSFGGWSANVGLTIDAADVTAGTPIAAGKEFAMPAEDVTLTAVWNINSYDLTWDLAGGTTTSAGTGIASGVSVNTTASVEYGATLSAPSVEKTGYTFSAWSPSVASTMPAENTTYTATWTKDTYTITYELYGGSLDGEKTSYQITDGDYDLPTPTWDGHTFLGWYATYSEDVYSDPVSVLASGSTGNKTYHAKWAASAPVEWTITKVDSKLYAGGGGYSVKAVVDDAWTGDASSLVLSASDGVTLGTPTKSTVDSKAQIVADFSISGSLAEDAITFSLYAPATGAYAAIEDEKEVELDACSSGGGSTTVISIFKGTSDGDNTNTKDAVKYEQDEKWTDATTGLASTAKGVKDALYVFASNSWTTANSTVGGTAYTQGIQNGGSNASDNHFKIEIPTGYTAEIYLVAGRAGGSLYLGLNKSAIAPQSGTHADKVWYASCGSSKVLQAWTIEDVPAGTYYLVGNGNDVIFAELKITLTGGSSAIATELSWSGDDASDAADGTVNKNDISPDFILSATRSTNSIGAITYTSSNTSVATVDKAGKVHIINSGTTTITATLAACGCYGGDEISYSLEVANTCADTPGTIVNDDGSAIAGNAISRGACEALTLRLTGHSGSTIQWMKDGENVGTNSDTYVVPAGVSGVYTATVTGASCTLEATNSITVTTAGVPEPTIFANDFYVKSDKWFGYRLMQINRGETVTVKTAPTGWTVNTDFSITTDASGIVSISGRKAISTPANKTLTLTIDNGCGGSVDKDITIREMAATAQPTIAWIATNNKGGSGQKDNVKADESTNTDLYDHLKNDYIITPRNCYWTTNEADLVKEYSQYDLIILTDYPNSGTCPSGKSGKSNSYTNAIGLLIDHKPIMTFEAFVAGCPNWGIASDPQNTKATQTDLTLLCNADEIFGTDGKFAAGEAITVTSASSGQALQGFPVASSPDFVFIGKITDSDSKTYVACCERQHEIAARMMVFGLNSSIMSSLTEDGKTMVKGFIEYLLKDDPASIPDCSVIFNGEGGDDSWYTTSNWEAGSLPDQYASVRIDAPCVVPENADPAKAGRIKIHVTDMNSGSLTIEPKGRMIVEKTITRIEGNAYTIHMPTEPEDLIIQSDETAQGALIFDNESGTTQATVEMYSKGRYYDGVYNWQYVAVPLVSASRWNMGDWAYCFDNSIGNWTGNDVCPAFSAVGVTRMDAELPTYEFSGPLASTKNQTLTLYTSAAGNDGYNMIGNSWTAPIQIVNFQPGDFGTALYQVNIYNTGHDPEDGPAVEESTDQQGRWKTIPIAATQAAIDAGTWEDLKVIPSMQAFEVQNATGANTTLTLNYDRLVRTLPTEPNLNETKRAPRRTPVERTAVPQMRITLKDETTRENLYLFSGEQFSEGFDNGWDGVYNAGEAGYMQIYMLSPIGNLEISAQPEMEGTTFGFTAGSREVYTFSFKYVGNEELYFNDLKEKKSTLINDENEYTFTAQEGENGIRFMISATPYNSQPITTGMTDLDAEAPQAQKVIYNDKLYIIRGGKVFSADGHLVK